TLHKEGLYDPQNEHDACGVGFVASLKNQPTHKIVQDALQILRNLEHRGACGCDALTGDGAGILIQLPDEFLRKVAPAAKIKLPEKGKYGVGMVFLPRKADEAQRAMKIFEKIIECEGQEFLGWRNVPVDNNAIGELARGNEPGIRQVFIGWGQGIANEK